MDAAPEPPIAPFGFVPLSATELAAVVLLVGGYVVATEIAKSWFFLRRGNANLRSTAAHHDSQT